MSLTEAERKSFAGLTSGQISDAMESLELRRSVVTGFIMLADPNTRIVGTAVTIRQAPKNATEPRGQRQTRHNEVTGKVVKKGDIVIVDVGGRCDVASWGEHHGYRCLEHGAVGAIVDGGTRDGPEIRRSKFPTFVRALTPVKSQWDLKTASINEPVVVGNVEICPGDVVFADETGVVVIPKALKVTVLAKALDISRKEEDANRALKTGMAADH